MAVAYERWTRPSFLGLGRARDLEIENAHAVARFTLVRSTVAGPHHDALPRSLFAAKINHRMRDRRIALDAVRPGPEKEIARDKFLELEGVLLPAVHRPEASCFAQPDILLAGIARHIGNAILRQHVNNETGAIHPTVRGIGRAILVIQIPRRQLKRRIDNLAHFWRIRFVPRNGAGRDGSRGSLLLWSW